MQIHQIHIAQIKPLGDYKIPPDVELDKFLTSGQTGEIRVIPGGKTDEDGQFYWLLTGFVPFFARRRFLLKGEEKFEDWTVDVQIFIDENEAIGTDE
jgi:hypothetical protein